MRPKPEDGLLREMLSRSQQRHPSLVVLAGFNRGETYRIEEGETFIGRGQYATLRLTDDGISRRHARLVRHGRAVTLQDLKSSNGTKVNGVALASEAFHTLEDGDQIQLGTSILKFIYTDLLDESPKVLPRAAPPRPERVSEITLSPEVIDVYISCAPADEPLRRELETHLAPLQRSGEINTFSASQVPAGALVREAIHARLAAARAILLLVSADFLASDACDAEVEEAMRRHRAGEALVIPIILRDCHWKSASFARLSELPRTTRTINSAADRDQAWMEVVAGLRNALKWRERLPLPSYPDAATLRLCEQIDAARARQRALREQGVDTAEVDREILDLRRRLREGGQLRAGDSLGDGRYLLLRQVGRGGFAIVWEAQDRERHERVAVKVLHSNLAGDPIRLDRFFRGARKMAELDHTGVVRVLELRGEDGGYHYFVMELVPGADFRQAVLKKTLAGEAVLPVILRVGEALAAAHEKGLVHRDVKPANILLDAVGAPRLSDFDLVGGIDTTGGTRTGALGTVLYTAPEVTDRPQDADARADVYSLAMTAVFGLHGAELSLRTMRNVDEFIDTLRCGEAVKAVLKRALDWDKGARFEDAGGFCAALRGAIAEAEKGEEAAG